MFSFFFFFSQLFLLLWLPCCSPHCFPLGVEIRLPFTLRFGVEVAPEMTLGRGITGIGEEGIQRLSSKLYAFPLSYVLQRCDPLFVDGVLPQASLSQDSFPHDKHSSVLLLSSLSLSLLTLSVTFLRSYSLTLSRSSHRDTRSAPAVHRYALGSGGSRV